MSASANEMDGQSQTCNDESRNILRSPMPLAINRAIAFVNCNTRHPMRIVGFNRVRLDIIKKLLC